MTREAIIEAAMQSCHVHAFIREDGEFQRTPVIVDTAYRTGFAFGVKAAIAAIEASGHAIVPVDSVAAREAVSSAIARDEPSWRVWREGVEAGKL